jgi:nucleoside-diphosphate-sugar epimerase
MKERVMGYHVVITGATGMIGKGVLLECLASDDIKRITLISRSPIGITHGKIREILLKDFQQPGTALDTIGSPDACFHCMGVSALGLSEEAYTQLTFGVTAALADKMHALNPAMIFIYVSGTGTDSSEQGRVMWARVKGRTENYVLQKGFAKAVMFRPGLIIPEKGIKSRTSWYSVVYAILTPFFPLLKRSSSITTTTAIGQAMIQVLRHPVEKKHVENRDINALAKG